MGSSKRHSYVEWCAYHLEHGLNGYTNLTANAHKNATLHKTAEVLGPRVWLRGSFSAFMTVSQSSSAVRAVSYFCSSQMETWISHFWAHEKCIHLVAAKLSKSSYWSSLSPRGNLRYLQRPCLQGHLIGSNGRLSWICTTVTLWSAFSKGEHWTVWIRILQGTESGRLWADGKYLGLPSDVP